MKISISSLLSTLILSSIGSMNLYSQELNDQQKDSSVISSSSLQTNAFKNTFTRAFKNFKGNELSLFGSLSLNHQNINDKGIMAPVNYVYSSVNSEAYTPGYLGGFRWDGVYKERHHYSVSIALNRVNAGSHYVNKHSLSPFIEDYTHFKADNKYSTISIAAHYKKLLPVNNMNKYKFYAVFGPSLDYKISNISKENLLNGAGSRAIINGDLGAEFDNKGYYVLYAHYKLGVNMNNTSVPFQLNRFEIGMSIKAKDLF